MTSLTVARGRRSRLHLGGRAATVLRRAAVADLDDAICEAREAERSSAMLQRRVDDRLARLLEAARTTRHYSSSVPEVVGDPRAVWAKLPVLGREEFRSQPTPS